MARTEVKSHRKFLKLTRALDLPEPYTLGLLEWMWQTAYESGTDFIGDADDVEMSAKWPGEKGKFFQAVLDIGWVDQNEDRYFVHDLWDHAPEYVKKRYERKMEKLGEQTASIRRRTALNGDERRRNPPNGSYTTQPNPQQPNTRKKGSKKGQSKTTAGFESFRSAYPAHRRGDRKKCFAIWQSLGLESRAEEIVAKVQASVESNDWTKEDGQYVPGAMRWLSEERYDAPPPTSSAPSEPGENDYLKDLIRAPSEEVLKMAREAQMGVGDD
jgi:hypothetical protein